MQDKILKTLGLVFIVLILAAGLFLGAKLVLLRPADDTGGSFLRQQRQTGLDDTDKQIQELDRHVAELRKELEENSRRVSELERRLEDTTRALASAERRLKGPAREVERPALSKAQPAEKAAPKPPEPARAESWRKAPEPGTYEIIRTTAVFEEPSGSSRKVATVERGTRVTVVGSAGEWLEVRSRRGNPPGFIRRDDAMYIQKRD